MRKKRKEIKKNVEQKCKKKEKEKKTKEENERYGRQRRKIIA
jgi:hypothetical protein